MNTPIQTPRFLDSDLAAVCQQLVDAAYRHPPKSDVFREVQDALDAAYELGITPTEDDPNEARATA
jgi:hypothetical protein